MTLRVIQGDLWDAHARGSKVVVTTNIGWHPISFENNMGAGMALQAWRRFPELARWYGLYCSETAPDTPVIERLDLRLVFFPVKPLLDPSSPERSWDQEARLDTIERSARELARIDGDIALAFPGCGNGGLEPRDVLPLLERHLSGDRFTIVDAFVLNAPTPSSARRRPGPALPP